MIEILHRNAIKYLINYSDFFFSALLYKGEFYDHPNSVDINSEEFTSLPPEMKHEILKEMKEFAKRRRTMYHKPPEVPSDSVRCCTNSLFKAESFMLLLFCSNQGTSLSTSWLVCCRGTS